MNLTEKLLALTLVGAEWVLWLLILLSVLSLAVMLGRWLDFRQAAGGRDAEAFVEELARVLARGDREAARKAAEAARGLPAAIAREGLSAAARGPFAAGEAMTATKVRE